MSAFNGVAGLTPKRRTFLFCRAREGAKSSSLESHLFREHRALAAALSSSLFPSPPKRIRILPVLKHFISNPSGLHFPKASLFLSFPFLRGTIVSPSVRLPRGGFLHARQQLHAGVRDVTMYAERGEESGRKEKEGWGRGDSR